MREKIASGEDASVEDVADWLKEVKEIDSLLRDRLFVLTVAAELGWRVAADMASSKKGIVTKSCKEKCTNNMHKNLGNMADKDLARAIRKEEKRKQEEKENRPKKKKGFNQAFRAYHAQPQQQAPVYQNPLAAAIALPPPPPPPLPRYPRPVESRSCIGCGQVGHLVRFCPRGNPSTSGSAQK